ncbi:MAG: PAS domain-containing protein [Planctomycetota bacterium]
MHATWLRDSLTTRLVAAVVLGGALLSIGVATVEWRRSQVLLAMEVSQRGALELGNVRSVARAELAEGRADALRQSLAAFTRSDLVRAIRVAGPTGELASSGVWPTQQPDGEAWRVWSVSDDPILAGDEVAIDGLTLARTTVLLDGQAYVIEMLLDGELVASGAWRRIWEGIAWVWVMIGVALLGLVMMLGRWVERPINELTRLVSIDAGAGELERWASVQSGQLGTLAEAMGRMLERVETVRTQLDRRERESDSLFRQAPVAMLSVTVDGVVTHANSRAAAMFGQADARELIDHRVDELVAEEDLPRLWATVERTGYRGGQRVEMRLTAGRRRGDGDARWAVVESVPITDADDLLIGLRLCFIDVTNAVHLRGELERQTRLLNLLIDHMSDAILLVDSDGRVAAANQQLAALLSRPASSLLDRRYDAATTWESLGPVDERAFVERLTQIEADTSKPLQARFETRSGTFVFRGVAVQDDERRVIGRLWVVHETTPHEQGQRMLIEQNRRLAAMRRIAVALATTWRYDEVAATAVALLREELGVDAVGITVRRSDAGGRCLQLVNRGEAPMGIAEHRALCDYLERRLLPRTISGSHTLHWADLDGGSDYGRAFGGVGLTSAAACAMAGSTSVVGVLWAGERGGEGLERHHLLMLETIGPLIASRLEVAEQIERLDALALLDPDSRLLNRAAVDRLAQTLSGAGQAFGIVRLDVTRSDAGAGTSSVDWPSLVEAVGRVVRRSTTIARVGDATLALVLPEASLQAAEATADRVAGALHDWVSKTGHTATLGWAAAPDDGHAVEGLIEAAETRRRPVTPARVAA